MSGPGASEGGVDGVFVESCPATALSQVARRRRWGHRGERERESSVAPCTVPTYCTCCGHVADRAGSLESRGADGSFELLHDHLLQGATWCNLATVAVSKRKRNGGQQRIEETWGCNSHDGRSVCKMRLLHAPAHSK